MWQLFHRYVCSEWIVRPVIGRARYPQSGYGSIGAPSGLDFVLEHLKVFAS